MTIGGVAGSSIVDFQINTDRLFYQGETTTTNNAIVGTAQATTIGGTASSILALPDGTTVTPIGVTTAQPATATRPAKLFGA